MIIRLYRQLSVRSTTASRLKFPSSVTTRPVKFFPSSIMRELKTEQVEQAIRYAKATLAVEGQSIPEVTEELIKQRLRREISVKEYRDLALKRALSLS